MNDNWKPDPDATPMHRHFGPADLPPQFPHGQPLGELTAAQSAPPRPSVLDMTQQAVRNPQEDSQ